jgi:adenylate cyclase
LATDAEQYTKVAEKKQAVELAQLMNDYYGALFESVQRQGGIVSDVIGDAMLAIWSASSLDISLHGQACQASLDMAKMIEQFNRQGGRPPLPTRIGLHSGEMLLGAVGASSHYEIRAVGDTVNTATRIQGLNKQLGTRLLASDAAVEGLYDFLTRPLGRFLLVGKSTPVGVVELLIHKHEASGRQLWLCKEFAAALEAYQTQQWGEAVANFSEILRVIPEDGPSRFYLQLCRHYAANPPLGPWDPTAQIKGK